MDIASIFNSYPGMYITQAFLHALIAALIVGRVIQAWGIQNPLVIQRFRFIVIFLPIFSFPLYQLINRERGSLSFRLEALFDSHRWFNVELWEKVPLSLFFILILSVTALLFLFQEMIPILKHAMAAKTPVTDMKKIDGNPLVGGALEPLPVEKPAIFIVDDDDHLVFSTVGRNPAIFLSSGLLAALNPEEVQAAVAHEIAHVTRNKRPLLIGVYLLRILMFCNPVVLLEFRRIVQEEEKICDDMAVALTRKPHVLAQTLRKLYRKDANLELSHLIKPSQLRKSLEQHSHSILMEDRIRRLENRISHEPEAHWFAFMLALATVGIINYFVV